MNTQHLIRNKNKNTGPRASGAAALSLALALAISLALAGCSLAPTYERPGLPVADAWPMQGADNASAQAAAHQIRWQEFFHDAQLRDLIALALDNNRDLRVAVLNIERARALYGIQSADRVPNINAGLSESRQRLPADVNPIGREAVNTAYFAGIGLTSFELDFFGRVRSLSDAALNTYFATGEARRSAHIALIAAVANTYESLMADRRLLALAQQTLQTRQDSYARQQQLRDQGAGTAYDTRQAESLLEAARAAVARQTRQEALERNALVVLIGQPVDDALLRAAIPADDVAADGIPVGLPSDLLAARPDIRQRESLLRAQNASIGAARANFFPRISLTGNFGSASSELSGLFGSGASSWSFLPQISLPIFDGGRNRATLKVAETDRDIAVAQYDKAIQVAFREVADALAGRATLTDELQAVRAQESAGQARVAMARQRYENGVSTYLEYLDAQRELFAVQQTAITVRLAEAQNRIALYKALGGGWTDDDEQRSASLPATQHLN